MALRDVFDVEEGFMLSDSGRTLISIGMDKNGKGFIRLERDGLVVNHVDFEKESDTRYPSKDDLELEEEAERQEQEALLNKLSPSR